MMRTSSAWRSAYLIAIPRRKYFSEVGLRIYLRRRTTCRNLLMLTSGLSQSNHYWTVSI